MRNIVLSKRLKELRKQAGYTQDELSQKLHLQRQTYCNYETGARTPALDTLIDLSDMYNVTLDDLVCGSSHALIFLTEEEIELLSAYHTLDCAAQREVFRFMMFKKYFAASE